MPIRLHLLLLFIANVAAMIGGFMLGMSAYEIYFDQLPEMLQQKAARFVVFGMLPAALGIVLSRGVFRYLIPGRCPKCGGMATYHHSGTRKNVFGHKQQVPITYHCRRCGHVHRTSIFPSSQHMNPDV